MTFCKKCGSKLKKDSKFCTSCGEKINLNNTQSDLEPIVETNKSKGLSQIETKVSELQQDFSNNNSLKNKLLGFYIIMVIPLYFMGSGSEEMIGFSIYSLVNIVVISLRINKPITFNPIVKLLLLLQFVFILSMVIPQVDLLFINLASSIATILFALLSLVIFLMVFIGNRSQS